MKLLIMQLSSPFCHYLPLRSNILPSTLFSNTLIVCSFFYVKEKNRYKNLILQKVFVIEPVPNLIEIR
jgi:hypothetical protein